MGFFKRFKKPKSTISLKIPTEHVELGDTLRGMITVASQEEFDSTEIRAELRCIERRKKERDKLMAKILELKEVIYEKDSLWQDPDYPNTYSAPYEEFYR